MEMEVGSVYQVDHSKLPSQAPGQLRTIRAVMVSKKTTMGTSVAFPSHVSLRAFFEDDNGRRSKTGLMQPNLDAQYEMGSDVAERVLFHQIPFEEFAARRGTRSFWVADAAAAASPPSKESEPSSTTTTVNVMDNNGIITNEEGQIVDHVGLVRWGKRRRATFIGKHKDRRSSMTFIGTVLEVDHDQEMDDQLAVELEGAQLDKEEDCWYSGSRRELKKRKGRAVFKCEMKKKMMKTAKEKKKEKLIDIDHAVADDDQIISGAITKQISSSNIKERKYINTKNRWTEERYKKAEKNILQVLKSKGAVYGKPILRPELRMEARKVIGDTGLLDHLLKHMAGKLAPGGKERFRRRHNPEGAMEYWLESAELANIRTQAGIDDPYWNPPPGWQPGDSPNQDAVCARDLKLLKQELADIKRKVGEIIESRNGKNQALQVINAPKGASDDYVQQAILDTSMLMALKVTHEELIKRKAKIDEQLLLVSKALQGMEKDVGKLLVVEAADQGKASAAAAEAGAGAGAINEAQVEVAHGQLLGKYKLEQQLVVQEKEDKTPPAAAAAAKLAAPAATALVPADEKLAAEKEARRQRLKSGFRICKPEGTFLWPDMALAASSSSAPSQHPQALVQLAVVPPADHLSVPTPPSVSSSAAPPSCRLPFLSTAVKPVPERPTTSCIITNPTGSVDVKDNNNNVYSPCSTTGSCITTFVPDLNEVPAAALGGGDHMIITCDNTTPPPPLVHQMQMLCRGTRGHVADNWYPVAPPPAGGGGGGGAEVGIGIGCWRVQMITASSRTPLMDHHTS
ncbi:hypothetical protein Dimus_019386 [Dionaea muscipula]